MKASRRVGRIARRARHEGVATTLERVALALAPQRRAAALASVHVLRREPGASGANAALAARWPAGLRHERIDGDAIGRLRGLVASASSEDGGVGGEAALLERFAGFARAGAGCHALFRGDEALACTFAFRRRYVVSVDARYADCAVLELGHRAVCLGNGIIHPAHRALGLFPLLVDSTLRAEGAGTAAWSTVLAINGASLAAHLRLGFRRVGTLRLRALGPLRGWDWRAAAPGARWRHLDGALPSIDPQTLAAGARPAQAGERASSS